MEKSVGIFVGNQVRARLTLAVGTCWYLLSPSLWVGLGVDKDPGVVNRHSRATKAAESTDNNRENATSNNDVYSWRFLKTQRSKFTKLVDWPQSGTTL